MQELKERLGMGARLENSLLGVAGGSSASSSKIERNEHIVLGTRVQVVKGRRFEDFGSGDTGIVVHIDADGGVCDVAFDGSNTEPLQVALRYLTLACSRTSTEPTCTWSSADSMARSPPAYLQPSTPSPGASGTTASSPDALRVPYMASHTAVSPVAQQNKQSPARSPSGRPIVPPLILPPHTSEEAASPLVHFVPPNSPLPHLVPPNLVAASGSAAAGNLRQNRSPEKDGRIGGWPSALQASASMQNLHPAGASPSLHDTELRPPAPHASIPSPISQRSPTVEPLEVRLQEIDSRLQRLARAHSDRADQMSDLEARFDLLEQKQPMALKDINDITRLMSQQRPPLALQEISGLDAKIKEVTQAHLAASQPLALQDFNFNNLDTRIRQITQEHLVHQLSVLEDRFDSLERKQHSPSQDVNGLDATMRELTQQHCHHLDTRMEEFAAAQAHAVEGIGRVVAPRLDAVDARMEAIATELDGVRALSRGGSPSDSLGNAEDRATAVLGESLAEVSRTVVALGQQVDSKFSAQSEALEKLNARVEALAEVGQWANDAIVVGQRVEAMFSSQNDVLRDKWELLGAVELRMDTLEGPLHRSIQAIEAGQELQKVLDSHISTSQRNFQVLDALRGRVDALGEVGQHATDAIKLGHELQEAVVGHRQTAQASFGSIGSQSSANDNMMGRTYTFGGKQEVAPNSGLTKEAFKAHLETLVHVERVSQENESKVHAFCEELASQKEALEAHRAATKQKFEVLDTFHVTMQQRCQQACEAAEKISSGIMDTEADPSAITQQFQAMLSEVRSDVARSEALRRHDLNEALDNLREELDATRPINSQLLTERNDLLLQRGRSPSPTPVLGLASGRVRQAAAVLRTSSAPVRERPMPLTTATMAVPQWPSSSPLQAAERRESSPVGWPGPARSSNYASPQAMCRHILAPNTPVLTLSSSQGVGLSSSCGAFIHASSSPRVVTRVASRGMPCSYCIMCGNMCMDDATMCRRCTLNSQRASQQAPAAAANTLVQPLQSSLVWSSANVIRTSSLSPNPGLAQLSASDPSSMPSAMGGSFSCGTLEDVRM